jgi:hypothetical protein
MIRALALALLGVALSAVVAQADPPGDLCFWLDYTEPPVFCIPNGDGGGWG